MDPASELYTRKHEILKQAAVLSELCPLQAGQWSCYAVQWNWNKAEFHFKTLLMHSFSVPQNLPSAHCDHQLKIKI